MLEELRGIAPSLVFRDFCYIHTHGWDVNKDVEQDLDKHYLKGFSELTVMSAADIFIGDNGSYNWFSTCAGQTPATQPCSRSETIHMAVSVGYG